MDVLDREPPLVPKDDEPKSGQKTPYDTDNNQGLGGENDGKGSLSPGENAEFDQIAAGNRDIGKSENSPTDGIGNIGATTAEKNLSKSQIKNNLSTPKTGMGKIVMRIGKYNVSRSGMAKAGGGGGLIVALVSLFIMGSSLYLVHLKELVLGKTNQVSNVLHVNMQDRRVRSMAKIIKKGSQKIRTDAFISKAAAAGFEVETKRGAIVSLRLGEELLDFSKSDREIYRSLKRMRKTDAGLEFIKTFDKVAPEASSRLSGVVVRRSVWKRLGIVRAIDWIGSWRARAGPDADGASRSSQFGAATYEFNDIQKKTLADLDPEVVAKEFNIDINDVNVDDVDDLFAKVSETNQTEFLEKIKNLAGETADSVDNKVLTNGIADISSEFDDVAENALTASDEEAARLWSGLLKKVGGAKATKLLGKITSGINVNEPGRLACRVKGTLRLVKSVGVIVLSMQLAKEAAKFFMTADHQKAGIIESESVATMATVLGGAAGASGIQSIVSGSNVSNIGLSKFNVGYSNSGILATISSYIDRVPLTGDLGCKISSSIAGDIAGPVVGVAIGLTTGGGSVLAGIAAAVGITVVEEVLFAVITPMLMSSVTGVVLTGFENPEVAGTALAAGVGAYLAMSGGASGGLMSSRSTFAQQASEAESILKDEYSKKSFAERYFDYSSSDSLIAKASLYTPRGLAGTASLLRNSFSASTIISPLGSLFRHNKAKAQASDQCTDVQAIANNLATDAFCNPITSYIPELDLEETEQVLLSNNMITSSGEPIEGSDYQKVTDNCFSGRTGLLYNEVIEDNGSGGFYDNTCIYGEGGEYMDLLPSDPGEGLDDETRRAVAAIERYSAWYGYKVDEENLSAEINGTLAQQSNQNTIDSSAQLNGYTIPCTGLPNTPLVKGARVDSLNWDGIPDSGTYGTDSAGNPMKLYIREACNTSNAKTLVLVSSIHANENDGQGTIFELLFKKQLPDNVRVIAMPEFNKSSLPPPGYWDGRQNKNGVNLNRNFDYLQDILMAHALDPTHVSDYQANIAGTKNYLGPYPDSEPETLAIEKFLLSLDGVSMLISFHDYLNYVTAAHETELKYSDAYSGYVNAKLDELGIGPKLGSTTRQGEKQVHQPGSLDGWFNEKTGIPSMLVEYPPQTSMKPVMTGLHADAIVNLFTSGVIE